MMIIEIDGVRGEITDLLDGHPFSAELQKAYVEAGRQYPQREAADGHFYVAAIGSLVPRMTVIRYDGSDDPIPPGAIL